MSYVKEADKIDAPCRSAVWCSAYIRGDLKFREDIRMIFNLQEHDDKSLGHDVQCYCSLWFGREQVPKRNREGSVARSLGNFLAISSGKVFSNRQAPVSSAWRCFIAAVVAASASACDADFQHAISNNDAI